jgi:hypothetical protein
MIIILCDTLKGIIRALFPMGKHPGQLTEMPVQVAEAEVVSVCIVYSELFICSVNICSDNLSKGRPGRNHKLNSGNGGGGGGGLIATKHFTNTGKCNHNGCRRRFRNTIPNNMACRAGFNGSNKIDFIPLLNGFLFNSIRSSVTGDQIDSICSNVIPRPITGTTPVGGSGTYEFIWQQSYNSEGPFSIIPGAASRDYVPANPETKTFWVRRIIKDQISLLTDTSKTVKIIVQPAITGNLVGKRYNNML